MRNPDASDARGPRVARFIANGAVSQGASPASGKVDANDIARVDIASMQHQIFLQKERKFLEDNFMHVHTADSIRSYDLAKDPKNLAGDGWLMEGGLAIFSGQSGIGKSSIAALFALKWAHNMDVFGIRPTRPLRTVIIQSENAEYDLQRELYGLAGQMEREGKWFDWGVLDRRDAAIVTCKRKFGDDFINVLRGIGDLYRPNVVFIDPLLGFTGRYSLSKQEDCAQFIRAGLMVVADEYKFAVVPMHHEPKPKKDDAGVGMYTGFGSSDLTNAARTVVSIRRVPDTRMFRLTVEKRAWEAGLRELDFKRVHSIVIEQAEPPHVYWTQIPDPQPEQERARAEKKKADKEAKQKRTEANPALNAETVISQMLTDKWVSKTQLIERLHELGVGRNQAVKLLESFVENENLAGIDPADCEVDKGAYLAQTNRGGQRGLFFMRKGG